MIYEGYQLAGKLFIFRGAPETPVRHGFEHMQLGHGSDLAQ